MLLVDVFEPEDIFQLLAQSVDVQRQNLVQAGFADYLWFSCDGHRCQVERKQWGEILSNPDHVEEQLRREMVTTEETVLLVEGVAEATRWGMDVYTKSPGKSYFRLQHSYGTPKHPQSGLYHRIQSWFWQLDKAGISVYRTCHSRDTASALVAWYKSSQKQEHTTLQRYIKVRANPKAYDARVLTLMGIEKAGLGEVKAKALIAKFGSVYAVLNAPLEELVEVDGIGKGIAMKLIEAVGRPFVSYE
jgi:ERCC4-type nuclease